MGGFYLQATFRPLFGRTCDTILEVEVFLFFFSNLFFSSCCADAVTMRS